MYRCGRFMCDGRFLLEVTSCFTFPSHGQAEVGLRSKKASTFLLRPWYEWCRLPESNWRPTDYKSVALPTELSRHTKLCAMFKFIKTNLNTFGTEVILNISIEHHFCKMVPRPGFEPGTRGFSILCSTNWAIGAFSILVFINNILVNRGAFAASLRRDVLDCFSFAPSTVFYNFFIKKCLFACFFG